MAKQQNKFFLYGTIVVAVAVVFSIFMVYNNTINKQKEPALPFYGPKGSNGEPHYVKQFSLLNQDSAMLTMKPYEGKVFVADFFFTTCQGICPIMTEGMLKVYHAYEQNPEVLFLSHTVDPEHDTPSVLKRYSGNRSIDNSKWQFVTGDKKQIYDLARYSYLVDASIGDGGPADFVHTENFALVDWEGRIRGYYDGTDTVEVNKLISDIDVLLKEK